MNIKRFIGYLIEEDVTQATKILIYPSKGAGSPIISELKHYDSLPETFKILCQEMATPQASFEFQKVKYFYINGGFSRLTYPCKGSTQQYLTSIGFTNDQSINAAQKLYGRNEFDIPSPDFLEVFAVGVLIFPR